MRFYPIGRVFRPLLAGLILLVLVLMAGFLNHAFAAITDEGDAPTPLYSEGDAPPAELTDLPESAVSTQTATPPPAPSRPPTLADFWRGTAQWLMEIEDTGLPIGESDTINMGNGVFWSYLHASAQSAGIKDSCGADVEFPGCVTRWVSTDGGQHFTLTEPRCIIDCVSCPCGEEDMTRQQQYPRVEESAQGVYFMVFEHDAQMYLTMSPDAVTWAQPKANPRTGLWKYSDGPCYPALRIGKHPIFESEYNCMAGGPPGIAISQNRIYQFVGLGQNPGHMGCWWSWVGDPYVFYQCSDNPIFSGAKEYGPLEAAGADANPYFDFRFVTSADVVRVGSYYYMAYEGIRGPSSWEAGRDNQFALGFARAMIINGPWEKYPGNPALMDVADNWGVGHADIVLVDGATYMYTATPAYTRGRYVLVYK